MSSTMFLIRGLPGSGKSTLAKALGFSVCEADNFFMDQDGTYNFDPTKLPQAHAACQQHASHLLHEGKSLIVSNTFSQSWELKPYLDMASKLKYNFDFDVKVTVVDLFDNGCSDEVLAARNTHGVPLHVISNMRKRWEHDWRSFMLLQQSNFKDAKTLETILQQFKSLIGEKTLETLLQQFKSRWSYIGEKIDFLTPHPFTAKTLLYNVHWGENKNVSVPIAGHLWLHLYHAADQAISLSGDSHHVFIENFIVNGESLELMTGS